MFLGVDYYPEQWDRELLEGDLDNIVELGCNVIRIGEFAWHLMEKTEGDFDFSFFDHVIARAKARGLQVMMGTPTATVPAWLVKKHPSVLSEFENGQKRAFGGRHVHCINSARYLEYAEKIIRAEVEHFKTEGAIVAWQIDNELGHEGSDVCYCAACRAAFQSFLSRKFGGDIARLNEAYGTAFWSQEYNSFDEIPTPTATITTHNPALRLDFERFRSDCAVRFITFQTNLIKEIDKDAVMFHDFSGGGLYKHEDYAAMAKPLDVVAYNNYPVWGGQKEPLPPHEIAFHLDYMRGLKQQNFIITEAIMGAQGHDVIGYAPRPNQAKMWSYQAFAHGCSSMLYFRYRGATKGAEQFCYGVLDADNVKRRKFYEVQSCFRDVARHAKALAAPIKSEVAILYDFDSLAAFRIQKQSTLLDVPSEMIKYYKPFYERNIAVDVIPAMADLSGYRVIILPQCTVQKEELAARVKAFAENGGTVVLTYRTAVKDENNNLVFGESIPLSYSDFAGVRVVETESLQAGQTFPLVGAGRCENTGGTGTVFRDMLEVTDADVLYYYGDKFYNTYAAVTERAAGRGRVYYIGCGLDEGTLTRLLCDIIAKNSIFYVRTPRGVEVCERGEGVHRVRIVLNHNGEEVVFEGGTLAPYECRMVPLSP